MSTKKVDNFLFLSYIYPHMIKYMTTTRDIIVNALVCLVGKQFALGLVRLES